ncbi:MAG: glycosyltransferase family 4 protein [Armatimonadetes bacterium]|nr:glycosyltransferase family 4 protein [Armatimonadota bacterium]
MRVALDATLLGARFSGVERAVAQLIAALARVSGDEVEVAAYVGRHFDAYAEAFHPDGLDPTGRLRLRRADLDNRNRLARLWWQQLVLPRLVQQAGDDLFHAPAYLSPVITSVPKVVTVYDLISLEQPHFATRANRLNYRLVVPPGLRSAQAISVPSEDARAAVARLLPGVVARCRLVPLGVEPRFGQADELDIATVRERLRLPERYLLWVGNMEPKKNVLVLLDALARLAADGRRVPRLVLAGALSWGTHEVMRAFLARGLQTKVLFLGRVRDEELPALYAGATAFLFPSLVEGFGLPPLEAMAAGVPVVGSTCGAVAEVVGDAGLLADPADSNAWAEAMVQVTEDDDLRTRLVARGRDRAAQYTWDRTARLTIEVYRELTGQG